MFLLQRNLQERFGRDAGFDFQAYKYGPFDHGVYEAIERLEELKFVDITSDNSKESSSEDETYQVTEKGFDEAKKLLSELDDAEMTLLRWVRFRQADKPLSSLLSYVYREYPDMTTESEIKDRVS